MNMCTSALTAENGTDDDSDQGKGGWSDMWSATQIPIQMRRRRVTRAMTGLEVLSAPHLRDVSLY